MTPEQEEREVMSAMRAAGFDVKQMRVLTYSSWKDGIDIERPTIEAMAFARLIRAVFTRKE